MDLSKIIIKGARENNLKNLTIEIPKNKLVVVTGVSGSGKSTLAFNTIYAEGQRRYVESLSSYARMFLGTMAKPDVDSIEGLSPAISIDQKTTSHNPRSTVGTVTEINDYLRLLYARTGIPYCPNHNVPIESQTIKQMIENIFTYPEDSRINILAPIARNEKGTFKSLLEKALKAGFIRAIIDDSEYRLDEDIDTLEIDKNKKHNISLIIDRLVINEKNRTRIAEALEVALEWGKGIAKALVDNQELLFSQLYACSECGFAVSRLEPRLFSFNAPIGACPDCNGLGVKKEIDLDILIPNMNLSISEGAIKYYGKRLNSTIEGQEFKMLCEFYAINLTKPIKDFTQYELDIVLIGSPNIHTYTIKTGSGNRLKRTGVIEGASTRITRLYRETDSQMMKRYYESFFREKECPTCHGQRLNAAALSVKVGELNIAEVSLLPIDKALAYFQNLQLDIMRAEIARLILKEISERLNFLINVGLEYLTLSRAANTLSGGEAQRIRLATQIGTKLSGVLYVLDEPSIGLHQRDNRKLINTLKTMRDLGNTLIVVEHDEETMMESDWLIDIGPGAGIHGGEIIAQGTPQQVLANANSITADYLSKRKEIPIPTTRRAGNGLKIEIFGAKENNLKNINVSIPLGKIVVITGVSGSGKSTLVNKILGRYLTRMINKTNVDIGKHDKITGVEHLDKIINISQEPIGRTPRSNPATYVTVFDDIRILFAQSSEARARGYNSGRFSFNVPGGRCEKCHGDGMTKVEMHFLADVYVTCDECNGRRYNDETLQIKFKEKNIHDVLEMTIEDAALFFENIPSIRRKMQKLVDVGLGYVKVGQSATTLSGGEAQRVKLAYELQRRPTGSTIYLLDEPTTGLHADDVNKLLKVLNQLADAGESILIIEHNLDVIKSADYIIDLGPEGGDKGGELLFAGTPEELIHCPKSYTGIYLKDILKK